MAADASIILGVKPPEPINPIATIGGLMQIQEGRARQALQAAQVRQADANTATINEQTQTRDRLNQSNARAIDLLKNPDIAKQVGGGDVSAFERAGIDPTIVHTLKKNALDLISLKAKNTTDQLTLADAQHNSVAKFINGVIQDAGGDLAKLQTSYAASLPILISSGAVNQGTFPSTLDSKDPLGQLQTLLAVNGAHQAAAAQALAQRETLAKTQKAEADAAIAGKKNVGTNEQGLNPTDLAAIEQHNATIEHLKATLPKDKADAQIAQQEAQFRAQHNGLSANELRTAQYQQGELAIRQKELALKSGGIPLTEAQKSIAEKLAAGDFNPAQLNRFPDKEALINGAIAINPNWTQATYDTKQAFDNPKNKQSQNLGTISRIVGHIGRFEENSAKMGTDPIYGMAGANLTGLQKSLSEDSHAIAAELEKLVSGGVGTEGQIKQWQSDLRSSFSGVREKAINEISKLAGSQFESMNQTYKTGTGKDLPLEKYVTGEGRKWLQKNGINVSGTATGAPAVGAIEDGHRFKGGSPADPKNWEKVN